MAVNGTPRALAPIARGVLAWVADMRTKQQIRGHHPSIITDDTLRRIELCALCTLDVGMMQDLYCVGPKEAPE